VTFEEYIEQQIKDGYISEKDLSPLKCWNCESKNFKDYGHDFLDYIHGHGVNLLEYKVKCLDCEKDVGYWSYGHWQV